MEENYRKQRIHPIREEIYLMKAYQFKVTIKGSRPPIWRRILISTDFSFHDLATAIIESFYWSGGHLWEFTFGNNQAPVGIPDDMLPPDSFDQPIDAAVTGLSQYFSSHTKCEFIYDFGDFWEMTVVREDEIKTELAYPQVIDFKGECPLEDCGGIEIYQDILKQVAHPQKATNKETLAVWKECIDMNTPFDMQLVNEEYMPSHKWNQGESGMDLMDEMMDVPSEKPMVIPQKFVMALEILDIPTSQMLSSLNVSELKALAKKNGLSGYSSLHKAELTALISQTLMDSERLSHQLSLFYPNEIEDLMEGVKTGSLYYTGDAMPSLFRRGYIQADMFAMVITQETLDLIRKILKRASFKKEQARMGKLRHYLEACVYFYGVCDFDQPARIYEACEGEAIDPFVFADAYFDGLKEVSMVALKENQWMDAGAADSSYFEALELDKSVLPFYMPTKQEVEEVDLCLPKLRATIPNQALVRDVNAYFRLVQEQAERIGLEVQEWIRVGYDFNDIFNWLCDWTLFEYSQEEDVQRLGKLFQNVWNSSRMIILRGHTPNEMTNELPALRKDVPDNIIGFPGAGKNK